MSNFTALKTAIQNAIRQNGNQEITGIILQNILISMVETMGDSAINTIEENYTTLNNAFTTLKNDLQNGYVYGGVATPSTTPASGKVFYVAKQAGTYTSFGNLVVVKGITILKKVGSTWTQDLIYAIDDVPTDKSAKLVESGGCVSVLRNILNDKFTSKGALQNYYIIGTGEIVSNQYSTGFAVTDYISVEPLDVVSYAYGIKVTSSTNVGTINAYDANKNLIDTLLPTSDGAGTYLVPLNAAYIRYNIVSSACYTGEQYLRLRSKIADHIQNILNNDVFPFTSLQKECYITREGTIHESTVYTPGFAVTDYVPVKPYQTVKFAYNMPYVSQMSTLNVYDANKNFLLTYNAPSEGAGEYMITNSSAAYIRYNVANYQYFDINDQYLMIQDDLGELMELIEQEISEAGIPNVVHVGPHQPITKFTDGLAQAMQTNGSILYVESGTYNIMTEYGSAANIPVNGTMKGPAVGNDVHIICDPNVILTADCDTLSLNDDFRQNFSILNVIGSFKIENATLIGKNIRYCVHDDVPIVSGTNCHSEYINCNMEHQGFNSGWSGYNVPACLGMGDSSNGRIVVEGGSYKSPSGQNPISLHNHSGAENSEFIVNNVYTDAAVQLYSFVPAGNTVKTRITNSYLGGGIVYIDTDQTRKFDTISFNIQTAQ